MIGRKRRNAWYLVFVQQDLSPGPHHPPLTRSRTLRTHGHWIHHGLRGRWPIFDRSNTHLYSSLGRELHGLRRHVQPRRWRLRLLGQRRQGKQSHGRRGLRERRWRRGSIRSPRLDRGRSPRQSPLPRIHRPRRVGRSDRKRIRDHAVGGGARSRSGDGPCDAVRAATRRGAVRLGAPHPVSKAPVSQTRSVRRQTRVARCQAGRSRSSWAPPVCRSRTRSPPLHKASDTV